MKNSEEVELSEKVPTEGSWLVRVSVQLEQVLKTEYSWQYRRRFSVNRDYGWMCAAPGKRVAACSLHFIPAHALTSWE